MGRVRRALDARAGQAGGTPTGGELTALLAQSGIAALRSRLVRGDMDALDLLHACLARIAAHDRRGARLSAMLSLRGEALEEARALDRARDRGEPCGPLHGIPIVLKDNIDLHGEPTTSGSLALRGAMPIRSAPVVETLRRAGAVVVGKTNLSEFSFEIRSRSSLGGDTRNAFDAAVTSGGSSGGAAVAVAAGFAVAAIGTDTGGSIRVPAAYNGLVGLRPTHGAICVEGVAPLAPSTDTVGPIARCVDDAALLFRLSTGAPEKRPSPVPLAGLRVGVLRQLVGSVPAIEEGLEHAIAALRRARVRITDAPPLPDAVLPIGGQHIVDVEFGAAFDRYLRSNFLPGTAPPSLAALVADGEYLDEYAPVLAARLVERAPPLRRDVLARHAQLTTALRDLMRDGGFDALVYPPSAVLPTSMENPKGGWVPELAARSGWPALVVPVGRSTRGMPLSVELLAPPHAEALLFALGRAIEHDVGSRPIPVLP